MKTLTRKYRLIERRIGESDNWFIPMDRQLEIGTPYFIPQSYDFIHGNWVDLDYPKPSFPSSDLLNKELALAIISQHKSTEQRIEIIHDLD